MTSILWLTDKQGYSGKSRSAIMSMLSRMEIAQTDVMFNSLHFKVPTLEEHGNRKTPSPSAIKAAHHALSRDISILKPKVIVLNDEDTLRAITGQPYTLATTRGSLYLFNDIPCIVVDELKSLWATNHGKFVFQLDMAKVARYAKGTTKPTPAFNYFLCKTVDEVRACAAAAAFATYIAIDTETANGFITCLSYTFDSANGTLVTFEIPFFDPDAPDGAYWREEADEIAVRKILKEINASPVWKALQNGTYDCAYFIVEGMPLVNYFLDSQNMMHSIIIEAPKKLHQLASYFCDNYTYWKDEAKGIKEDDFGRDHTAVERYWRYNGLDTYYTWLVVYYLIPELTKLDWAVRNYNTEFSLSIGPCLAMSLRGLILDKNRHAQIMSEQTDKAAVGLLDMRRLTGEADFNPNSSADNGWFLYDICGAKPTRLQRKGSKYGPRSTDEKVLKLVKEQGNIIANNFIDRLLKAKKPAAILSKYGNLNELLYRNARFLSWHNASGTDTGRLNSGSSQFWTGTNAQNIPDKLHEMFVADPDYVFVDIDYSASDDHFIAYECEDEKKIAQVESDKDTHCFHCSIFFSRPYELIYKGWKADDPIYVDPIKGIRQNTKRVTHGKNFLMGAATMYNTMGKEAVIETALALGHEFARRYNDKELIGICNILCDKYDHEQTGLYRRIRPWHREIVADCAARGGLATCAFGLTRKFLGDVANDHKKQRELAAFYGQGGTAGNINRAVRKIFYSSLDDGKTVLMLVQGHDSLLLMVHKNSLGKITKIKEIMEEKTTIHGREMGVPTNITVGRTWSKKMLPWTVGITYDQILAFEKKTFSSKYNRTKLDIIAAMNLDGIVERRPREQTEKVSESEESRILNELEKIEAQDADNLLADELDLIGEDVE